VVGPVVCPDRIIVNVQQLSAPVTDITYPCYRDNFLHHHHRFSALMHRIKIFQSCVFMDYTIRSSAPPEFSLTGSCNKDHRFATFTAEDLSHGFLQGLSLALDYIEKTGDSQPVRQGNDCRTSDTIACISTIRPGPGCERFDVLNCKVDLLLFFYRSSNPPSDEISATISNSCVFHSTGNFGSPITIADENHHY